MNYSAIGSVASTMITNYFSGKIAGVQAGLANDIRALNNETLRVTNRRDAVLTGMQRWRQKVYNERVHQNAEKDKEVGAVNYWRQKDARKRASFAEQIRYAEEDGRMQASAAASGVSGSVVDMLNATTELRKGLQEQQAARTERQFDYDYGRAQFSQWWANMDQMDYSLILDNPKTLDFNVNTANAPGLLSGVSVKDVKDIAQGGYDFFFKQPDPIGDFYQRGSRGAGD